MASKFYFFSKSANKLPGKGAQEFLSIGDEKCNCFSELSRIPHWRRVLSNFYEGEFSFDGLKYATAEHAFQAQKINLVDSRKGYEFSLDCGSELSKGNGEAARRQRKMVLLNNDQIRYWRKESTGVMNRIWKAKFTQVNHARDCLLATKHAELWHGARGIPKARQYGLEAIRAELVESACISSDSSVDKPGQTGKKRKRETDECVSK